LRVKKMSKNVNAALKAKAWRTYEAKRPRP